MSNKKILVIDDDDAIRMVAEISLTMTTSWSVQLAISGADGIELAAAEEPNVILLDVMMPGMDGITTLKRLKAKPNTQNIPVIFLTAQSDARECLKFDESGAIGIIAKPFEPGMLARQISCFLGWSFPGKNQ